MKWFMAVAQKAHIQSTTQVIFIRYGDDESGGTMSRAERTAGLLDNEIIAFLLFCLEMYQTEQQRKRKLH